ncbi:MAG: DNA polymerase III subunit beta [Clostridia bacterium]|nr:DNA polymerase III subunit beta [Clostridia bacterium]
MKMYIDSKELASGVLSVTKALPVRSAMPVLEGVFLLASSEGLRMKCSDLMLQKECLLPATVELEGRCIVPGKLFSEIVRKLPEGAAEITLNNKTLDIRCGRASSSLQCIEWDDFPEMRFTGDAFTLRMARDVCRDMINETVFAAAQDESKPVLTGVLMELENDSIHMVATDAYQFAMRSAKLQSPAPEKALIIPAKSIVEIARMMDETGEDAALTFTSTHVKVDIGHTVLIARLLDGDYIKYRQILPKEHKTRVLLDRAQLIESIDRAQLMAREGNNNIVMKFHGNRLTILANSFAGKINEEMEAQINGEDIDIAFNPKFCMNILKCLPDEKIYMDFNTSISPCVVRPAASEGYYYLIVPVRIYSQL